MGLESSWSSSLLAGSGRPRALLRRQIGVGASTATLMPAVLRCSGNVHKGVWARQRRAHVQAVRLDRAECCESELSAHLIAALRLSFA